MTTPTLPSYAKLLRSGYQHQRESALLRTDMESGPPKQVMVRSRVMVTRTVSIYIPTKADFEAFELWYSGEIKEGALWFTYFDPVSQSTKLARFVGGGYSARLRGNVYGAWVISAKIESWGS